MKKATKKGNKKVVKPKNESVAQNSLQKEDLLTPQERYNQMMETQLNYFASSLTKQLNPSKLQEAIILSEVLGKPVSKRRDRHKLGRGL